MAKSWSKLVVNIFYQQHPVPRFQVFHLGTGMRVAGGAAGIIASFPLSFPEISLLKFVVP